MMVHLLTGRKSFLRIDLDLAVAMGSIEILVDELMEVETEFERDFDSTKMHRFPAVLREDGGGQVRGCLSLYHAHGP
ncbi:hypothetical protein ZWY2020_007728 [Hordeum vulgare]|nr:hypothetical protein ZWY2020_007728 [Hordeum vulgare]